MIVYNSAFAIADDLDPWEFLSLVKQQYLNPAVETGYFSGYTVLGLLRADHGDPGSTFACQLHTSSIDKIDVFESEEKDRLDAVLNKKFGERCLSFITVLGQL